MINLIIRFIINIFDEIFSQDVERRRRQHGQSQGGPKTFKQMLQDRLAQLSPEERRALGLPPLPQPPQLPPSKRIFQSAPPELPPQQYQTVKEHLRETRQHQGDINKNAKARIGKHTSVQPKRGQGFSKLPGQTPLEQLVYAQIIVGPCHAHRRRGRPSIRPFN